MVKNYIKTALRNLLKNKLTSFINIFGLALAIGCSLVVYVFINFEFTMNSFHENKDNIYLVTNVVERDGNSQEWGDSPSPIGAMLKQDFSQIDKVVRFDGRGGVMRYNDKVFQEFVRYADDDFFNMFTFKLKWGSADAHKEPSKVIISERISDKYFGSNNPVGEQITFTFGDKVLSYEIGGVAEKFPNKSSFNFNILASYDQIKLADEEIDFEDWTDFISATFIQVNDPQQVDIIREKMDKYVALQNAADEDWPASSYPIRSFNNFFTERHDVWGSVIGSQDPVARVVLSIIGIFMLVLACFNYINIAVVSATKRLKEIGIRKVVGGSRKMIVWQFLSENVIITFFALVLGVVFAWTMFVPWFDNLFTIGLTLDLSDPILWFFFIAILLITGVASGAYPAFYISSFKAVSIFRGKQKFGGKNIFTKIFLTFQFVLALLTIVCGIMFVQNVDYQRARDWGYNQEQTLVVPVPDQAAYAELRNEVIQNPNVIGHAGSANHLGRSNRLAVVEIVDKKYEFRTLGVGEDYVEIMELRLLQGRSFDKNLRTDIDQSILINETMMEKMEWEDPIGKSLTFDSVEYFVVGVLEDFHYQSFWNKIRPTFVRLAEEEDYRFLSLRVKAGSAVETADYLEATWKKMFPDLPYTGFYQDQVFDNYFQELDGHGKIMAFTATLAVILSCMGLFGLVSLNVARKMRDFSIRKVLGAGLSSIVGGVNQQFIWLLGIAVVIGGPLSYFVMQLFFASVYDSGYYMPVEVLSVMYGVFLLVITAVVTVSSQVYKVLVSNPVDSLRNE